MDSQVPDHGSEATTNRLVTIGYNWTHLYDLQQIMEWKHSVYTRAMQFRGQICIVKFGAY